MVKQVETIAKEHEVKPAQITLAWLLHKDYVTAPFVGLSRIEHLEEALEALEIKLSPSDMERLEEPYKPHLTHGQGAL